MFICRGVIATIQMACALQSLIHLKEIYGDMLVVRYLIRVGDEKITPGDEVEDARFFDIAELPDYFAKRHSEIIELIQSDLK